MVLCGCVSEFEGLQNKIKYQQHFKAHLDETREGTVTLSQNWTGLSKNMAATLFGTIPSSAKQQALQNFLKAEELQPGFSKSSYTFLAISYWAAAAAAAKSLQSCPTLFDPIDGSPPGFPTQRLNRGVLHCRQILYQLSSEGSPSHLITAHFMGKSHIAQLNKLNMCYMFPKLYSWVFIIEKWKYLYLTLIAWSWARCDLPIKYAVIRWLGLPSELSW